MVLLFDVIPMPPVRFGMAPVPDAFVPTRLQRTILPDGPLVPSWIPLPKTGATPFRNQIPFSGIDAANEVPAAVPNTPIPCAVLGIADVPVMSVPM